MQTMAKCQSSTKSSHNCHLEMGQRWCSPSKRQVPSRGSSRGSHLTSSVWKHGRDTLQLSRRPSSVRLSSNQKLQLSTTTWLWTRPRRHNSSRCFSCSRTVSPHVSNLWFKEEAPKPLSTLTITKTALNRRIIALGSSIGRRNRRSPKLNREQLTRGTITPQAVCTCPTRRLLRTCSVSLENRLAHKCKGLRTRLKLMFKTIIVRSMLRIQISRLMNC